LPDPKRKTEISKNLVIFQIDPKSQVLPNSEHNNSTDYTTQGHRSSMNDSLKTLGGAQSQTMKQPCKNSALYTWQWFSRYTSTFFTT